MKNSFLTTTALLCLSSVAASAAPMTFDFSQGGFTDNGFLTGSFIADDLDGNGQISSFNGELLSLDAQYFSDTQEVPVQFEFSSLDQERPPFIDVDGPFELVENQPVIPVNGLGGLVFDLDGLGIIGDGMAGDVEGLALSSFDLTLFSGPGALATSGPCDGSNVCGQVSEFGFFFDDSDEVFDPTALENVLATTTESVIVTGPNLGVVGAFETNPILTGVQDDDSFLFDVDWELIPPGEIFFFDPEIAVGYTYEITGTEFAAVQAPSLFAVADADGEYLLTYTGASGVIMEVLAAGDIFNFDAADAVTSFTITGIDVDLALDPTDFTAFITGLAFAGTATGLSQTPITINTDVAAVPLPASSLLLLAGMGGLVSMRRRAKA